MQDVILSPTDFVALLNQTLEFAYPAVAIEGELSGFRVAKNRWVYFDLKDEVSNVSFFGTVYNLPGPLEDGLKLRVTGTPRMHPKFGFSINIQSILPVGEGSLKKAADLVRLKLEKEGLFAAERKRPLPAFPDTVGLITAANSAAYADFIKILNERWGGVRVLFIDTYVQGEQAPMQIARAIEYFNESKEMPDALVVTRGGGSAEDLAAFNDERVVRAVAASRTPTLVAVGHEIDESLAELAADVRASTPSNAAQMVVPDRTSELASLKNTRDRAASLVANLYDTHLDKLYSARDFLNGGLETIFSTEKERLAANRRLTALFDPTAALRRGYAIVRKGQAHITKVGQVKAGDDLSIELSDGRIKSKVY